MYKNFNLTEKERQQILESHKSHGYRKPLNESRVFPDFRKPAPGESSYERFLEKYYEELTYVVNRLSKVRSTDLSIMSDDDYESLHNKFMNTYDENVFDYIESKVGSYNFDEKEIARFAISNMNRFGTEPQMVIEAIKDFVEFIYISVKSKPNYYDDFTLDRDYSSI